MAQMTNTAKNKMLAHVPKSHKLYAPSAHSAIAMIRMTTQAVLGPREAGLGGVKTFGRGFLFRITITFLI